MPIDISTQRPDMVEHLGRLYEAWAERCGVIPRARILEMMRELPGKAFWEDE